jgi:two-component system response regulator DesR
VEVLLVHPEPVFCCGWQLLVSRVPWAKRCLIAKDEPAAVAAARHHAPAVAVLDLDQGLDCVTHLAAVLHGVRPELPLLLLAGRVSVTAKAAALIGATGVVSKTLPLEDLSEALYATVAGHRVFLATTPTGAGRLSLREREVLQFLSAGATNGEIADELNLSRETIKRHAAAIYRKLGVRNRTEAAQRGLQLGLTPASFNGPFRASKEVLVV